MWFGWPGRLSLAKRAATGGAETGRVLRSWWARLALSRSRAGWASASLK
jgi:hypothetical protein